MRAARGWGGGVSKLKGCGHRPRCTVEGLAERMRLHCRPECSAAGFDAQAKLEAAVLLVAMRQCGRELIWVFRYGSSMEPA